MSQIAVRCKGLSKAYGISQAVKELDLVVEQGQILTILGPSGGGKTTTLRLIAGFEAPDAGTVEIGDTVVASPEVFVPPEQRRVGMVFQDYALFPHLSVADNIAYGLPKGEKRNARLRDILALVGLTGLASRMPHELSGGEQQRVALARALAPEPEVVLLDEPFSNLDANQRREMRQEVKEILKASNATAIFVTHHQREALVMSDLVAVLNQGHLEQVDNPEMLFHHPRTRFVAEFLGIANFLDARISNGLLLTEVGALKPSDELPPDAKAQVMLRPDDVTIRPSPEGEGRVVDRLFQGMHYIYTVALPSGTSLRSLQPHTAYYELDTTVSVRLEPNHALTCFVDGGDHEFTALTTREA